MKSVRTEFNLCIAASEVGRTNSLKQRLLGFFSEVSRVPFRSQTLILQMEIWRNQGN